MTEADMAFVRLTVAEAEALLRLIVICVEHADQQRCTWTDIRQALDQLPQGLVTMNEPNTRHFELVCQICQRRVRCCETETDLRQMITGICPACWQGPVSVWQGPRCREFNDEAGIG